MRKLAAIWALGAALWSAYWRILVRMFAAFGTVCASLWFAGWYSLQILAGPVDPSSATWLIFWIAVMLSFSTYRRSERKSAVDNIANASDIAGTSIIFGAVFYRGGVQALHFKAFDAGCLVAAMMIIGFWAVTKNHIMANLLTQVLLVVGYFPTISKLLASKENTESLAAWFIMWAGSALALYPPLAAEEKNWLAAVYAIRALIFTSVLIGIMVYKF
ncbi:MAG: hypothetical protein A2122_01380 [Candidatus Liptonbacteria bacterium GWB1_49_6]|uniref:Uncharacterized protein n=1 Tax=Candidatus Liptonbacteria bacterium GWB1_49_6 TaxID=1798644 RepID=A0A1G2C4M4_9BACT|nr:MAG: hypothetical protein A2122_01380 [Candidatus Liptonbacteria bacterium GWB1_49_6]